MHKNLFQSPQADQNQQKSMCFEQSSNNSIFSEQDRGDDLFQNLPNFKSNEIADLDLNILKALSLYHQAKEELELLEFSLLQSSIMSSHIKEECDALEISIQAEEMNLTQIEEQMAILQRKELVLFAQVSQKKRNIAVKVKCLEKSEFDRRKAINQYEQIQKKSNLVRQSLEKRINPSQDGTSFEVELTSLKIKMKGQLSKQRLSDLKEDIKKEKQNLREIMLQISNLEEEHKNLQDNDKLKIGSKQSIDNVFNKMHINNESTFVKSTENNENINVENNLVSIQKTSLANYFEKSTDTSYRKNKNTIKKHHDHKLKKRK